MPTLTLFHTSSCHLCEQAEALVRAELEAASAQLVCKDISESDQLMHRYALIIPVLQRDDSGAELNWPFSGNDIREFLNSK